MFSFQKFDLQFQPEKDHLFVLLFISHFSIILLHWILPYWSNLHVSCILISYLQKTGFIIDLEISEATRTCFPWYSEICNEILNENLFQKCTEELQVILDDFISTSLDVDEVINPEKEKGLMIFFLKKKQL